MRRERDVPGSAAAPAHASAPVEDALRRGWCPGALRPMETGDGLLVRVRPPGGRLTADACRALADAASTCGNGAIDLSARANLQLRGVREAALPDLHARLDALGLLDPGGAEAEARRSVLTSPLAGDDPAAWMDVRAVAAAVGDRLATDAALADLPAKFAVVVDDGGAVTLDDVGADVRLVAVGADRLALVLDGAGAVAGVAASDAAASVAWAAAVFLEVRGDARRMRGCAEAVARVLRARPGPLAPSLSRWGRGGDAGHGGGSVLRQARDEVLSDAPPHLLSRRPDASQDPSPDGDAAEPARRPLRGRIAAFAGMTADGERAERDGPAAPIPPPLPPGERVGVRGLGTTDPVLEPHTTDPVWGSRRAEPGLSAPVPLRAGVAVAVGAPYGRLDAASLAALADLAETFADGTLRPGPRRLLFVAGATPHGAAAFRAAAEALGLVVHPDDPRRRVEACPGAPACGSAHGDTRDLAARLARLVPEGRTLHVSGCAKGCAHPGPADLTLVRRPGGDVALVVSGRAGDPPARTGAEADIPAWIAEFAA